jgi:hypothetical protein
MAIRIRAAISAVHAGVSAVPILGAISLLALFRVWSVRGPFDPVSRQMLTLNNDVCIATVYAVPIWLLSWAAAIHVMPSRSQLMRAIAFGLGWLCIVGVFWLSPAAFSTWLLD